MTFLCADQFVAVRAMSMLRLAAVVAAGGAMGMRFQDTNQSAVFAVSKLGTGFDINLSGLDVGILLVVGILAPENYGY